MSEAVRPTRPVADRVSPPSCDFHDPVRNHVDDGRGPDPTIGPVESVGVDVTVEHHPRGEDLDHPVKGIEAAMSGVVGVADTGRRGVGDEDVDGLDPAQAAQPM